MSPNILIGLLSYGGEPKLLCVKSLFRFFQAATANGIGASLKTIDMTGISLARNVVASLFYASPEFTHLLFIDDDMSAEANDILRLINSQKPLIGLAYVKRTLDLKNLMAEARKNPDRVALARSSEFALHLDGEVKIQSDGLFKVAGIGMGATLISREVFEKMAASVRRQDQHGWQSYGLNTALCGFFDFIYHGNSEITEDISFCMRWTQCGGEVWAIADANVGHVGEFTYRAKFSDRD